MEGVWIQILIRKFCGKVSAVSRTSCGLLTCWVNGYTSGVKGPPAILFCLDEAPNGNPLRLPTGVFDLAGHGWNVDRTAPALMVISTEKSYRLQPDSNGDERTETSDQQGDLESQGRHLLLVVTQCHEGQFEVLLEEMTLTVQLISQSPFL